MGRRFATINGKRQRSGKGQALDRRPGMSRARTGAGAGCKTKKYLRSRQGRIPSVIIDWYGNYPRSEEHTSELQSLMRISYAVFCLKKKIKKTLKTNSTHLHLT